ncbi:MAG TPA: hypothetical protein VGI97_12140, partial [Gemmatimonadaceae bacterium]
VQKPYHARILRQNENYSVKKLGIFGSDLGALACFFEKPWSSISPELTEIWKAWVLTSCAFCLRALGRLAEAGEPLRAGFDIARRASEEAKTDDIRVYQLRQAAIYSSNLSELDLTLGEVAGAVGDAEQSVTYADRSGDAFMRLYSRTIHADALHQAGRRAEAETRFREAEQMQAESQPAYPLLYSMSGFQYCDLLLAAPERAAWQICLGSAGFQPAVSGILPGTSQRADSQRSSAAHEDPPPSAAQDARRSGQDARAPQIESCRAVSQRAAQTLKIAERNNWLLDIALDHLTLGRAALYEAILEGRDGPLRRPRADEARDPTSHSSLAGSSQLDDPASDGFETARRELNAAVDGLRRAGTQHMIPRALLTRAWLRFLTGARMDSTASASSPQAGSPQAGPESAQEDLDEAWEIAERGPMKLFLADIHLYRARLFGSRKSEVGSGNEEARYPWNKNPDGSARGPRDDLAAARRLIEQCGYGRRKEELEDAEAAILGRP